MKSIIIFTSIFLLCGCAINTKSLSSPKSNDDKTILEAEKYKQQYQKKSFELGMSRHLHLV